jgi:hypothetical protein
MQEECANGRWNEVRDCASNTQDLRCSTDPMVCYFPVISELCAAADCDTVCCAP